eukprot:scaffold22548_cov31-Prasinocladus_malaysianus.AAC.1
MPGCSVMTEIVYCLFVGSVSYGSSRSYNKIGAGLSERNGGKRKRETLCSQLQLPKRAHCPCCNFVFLSSPGDPQHQSRRTQQRADGEEPRLNESPWREQKSPPTKSPNRIRCRTSTHDLLHVRLSTRTATGTMVNGRGGRVDKV